MVCYLRNSRRLEKLGNLELDLRDVVDVAENVGGQERVSARGEEVIVNADLLDLEDLCPVLGQHLLEHRPRRNEVARLGGAGRDTKFSGQADTLHFAGRAFWDFPYDE